MEALNLEPLSAACVVSGEAFAAGDRVMSYLVQGANLEVLRADVREDHADAFVPPGTVVCRWVQAFKPRAPGANADRALKLTAETLFLTLADPLTEPTTENVRMMQFLALMLERKRLLKPRGRTRDGGKTIYEHVRTKQMFEIATDELSPSFFLEIQAQLGVLVGEPKPKAVVEVTAAPAPQPIEAEPSPVAP